MEMNLFKRFIEKFKAEAGNAAFVNPAANQANSTATDAAGLATDFNNLLTKLKAAGIMVADTESEEDESPEVTE